MFKVSTMTMTMTMTFRPSFFVFRLSSFVFSSSKFQVPSFQVQNPRRHWILHSSLFTLHFFHCKDNILLRRENHLFEVNGSYWLFFVFNGTKWLL